MLTLRARPPLPFRVHAVVAARRQAGARDVLKACVAAGSGSIVTRAARSHEAFRDGPYADRRI
jgi:hypothetical protein